MKRCRLPALHDTHTHTPPLLTVERLAIAIRREIDWIVEKRGLLASEGKRKSEDVIASAASVWPSGVEQMVKEAWPGRLVVGPVFFASRRDAVAAITSGGSRNRGEHRP